MDLYTKLWHDDVRPPPDDTWAWAKTNKQAQLLLAVLHIEECSLDHDLGGCVPADAIPSRENLYIRGRSQDGSGLDLAEWMVENHLVPPKVTIHSWNPSGARRMLAALCGGTYDYSVTLEIKPYEMPR